MFDQIDVAYYRLRAQEMREKALCGANPEAVLRHNRLAQNYDDRADALAVGCEAPVRINL